MVIKREYDDDFQTHLTDWPLPSPPLEFLLLGLTSTEQEETTSTFDHESKKFIHVWNYI